VCGEAVCAAVGSYQVPVYTGSVPPQLARQIQEMGCEETLRAYETSGKASLMPGASLLVRCACLTGASLLLPCSPCPLCHGAQARRRGRGRAAAGVRRACGICASLLLA